MNRYQPLQSQPSLSQISRNMHKNIIINTMTICLYHNTETNDCSPKKYNIAGAQEKDFKIVLVTMTKFLKKDMDKHAHLKPCKNR